MCLYINSPKNWNTPYSTGSTIRYKVMHYYRRDRSIHSMIFDYTWTRKKWHDSKCQIGIARPRYSIQQGFHVYPFKEDAMRELRHARPSSIIVACEVKRFKAAGTINCRQPGEVWKFVKPIGIVDRRSGKLKRWK
jgi:hypothetical protein